MAQKVAAVTGAWSAAATWNSVTNTPTLHASTNITISTSNLFTATFTAPNTTNACTGALIYIVAVGSGGTTTVTLQESTVDTAATVSIATTALVAGTWVYFRFPTPYVFTTTGAGAYRFRIVNAAAAGTTTAAADSGGANIAYLATDDRTGVPGTTDDIWICGQNQATAITVTMDGTQTIGSKTDTALVIQRTLGNAISLNNLGVLAWDTTADATLTCGGNILCNNNSGELRIGTVASPMPAARIAKLRFDMAVAGNHGLKVFNTGKLTIQGTPKSSTSLWKAKYVSGTGVAASPLVVDASVDWSVGDEIAISATSANATNYNETEYRFIITKNSATSYVLSATSGGVEAAFTHTHTTNAWVVNIQRNILIDSTDSTRGFYINNACVTVGNVDVDWVRCDIIGSNNTNKFGLVLTDSVATATGNFDYVVCSRYHAAFFLQSSTAIVSYTGLVAVTQSGSNSTLQAQNTPHNKTFIDCFIFGSRLDGFQISGAANWTMTRCYALACNTNGNAGSAGFNINSCSFFTLNDCEVHCTRSAGINLNGANDFLLTNFLCGTKGINQNQDIFVTATGFYNIVAFVNSSFGSALFFVNYTSMLPGSEVTFHALNGVSTNHAWYTRYGIARSTGAGLADTTVKTAGSLGLRIAPEDLATGFTWEFLIGIRASSAASIFGFAQKNVAFGTAVCTVELFLPGSTVADATATLDNTTGAWQVFNLAANYTGLVAAFATIRVTAKTATAAAYVYFDDFYNGTNVLTALDAWYNGKPTPVMTDLLGDPAAVWTQLTSTFTTAGTVGKLVADNLDASIADVEADTQNIQATLATNLDAAVSSRASQTSLNTLDDYVDTEIADIQARIPAALTAGGNIKADTLMIEGVDATNQIRDSVLTDATRFAGGDIATILAAVDTEVATLITNVAAILAAVDTEVGAIKAKTDNLPTDPADESNILAAIAAISVPTALAIADQILKRGVVNTQDTADTGSLTELILAAFESSISSTAWTIRKTGGTTFNTRTLTLDAAALPIAGVT